MRRTRGEGTVYLRKDGRYEASAYVTTTSGARKRVSVYGKTVTKVRSKLRALHASQDRGVRVADTSWSVSAYLDYWLAEIVKVGRRPGTHAQCEQITRLYLKPGLGQQPLASLSTSRVQRFLNGLLAAGHSVALVQIIRKVLSAALTSAMREEILFRNPARLATLPGYQPAEIVPWSAQEATRFLDGAAADPFYPGFVLLVLYGMRRGEVLGLRWSDIDFDTGVVHVRQQVQRVRREILVGPVKTAAGRRDLPLLEMVRTALVTHRDTQQARRVEAGERWQCPDSGELVLSTDTGAPVEPSTFVRAFRRVCAQQGLRIIRVHDVRHTTATLLKQLGVPARDAQLILGHAKMTTTQQIYQHGDLAARQDALRQVEQLLRRGRAPRPPYSRQFSRQNAKLGHASVAQFQRFTDMRHGAGKGTLTLGLVLGNFIPNIETRSLTDTAARARARYIATLLGAAAVNFSRQSATGDEA